MEKSEDWHIQDILLESYYELKTDIPLYTIDRFLTTSHVTVRQFAFKLLIINSQIDNNIKRDRAFKYLDNSSLRIFALELLFEVGIKEDILRLIEYRVVQDLGFQEKLGWCIDGILGRNDIKVL